MSDFHGKRVLIVDDDTDLVSLLAMVFRLEAAEVFTACDGKQGLRQFQACQPDLVILDLMLPDMDGCHLCRQIRQVSKVSLIMLSAMGREQDIVRGLGSGADDYVTKPYSIDVLMARTRAVLRRRARSQEMVERSPTALTA
jgi:DNA-binding response OmpR family regulator